MPPSHAFEQAAMYKTPRIGSGRARGDNGLLRSDDRHAGIKKNEQQHDAAYKSTKDNRYQGLPGRLTSLLKDARGPAARVWHHRWCLTTDGAPHETRRFEPI